MGAGRPVVLLTDIRPDLPSGGGTILRSLLGSLGRPVAWASPSFPGRDEAAGWYGLAGGALGRRGAVDPVRDCLLHPRRLAEEVRDLCRRVGAAGVWAVAEPVTTRVVRRLLRGDAPPVHLTVHDHPAWTLAIRAKPMLPLVPLLAADFRACYRRARSRDVVCEQMAARYRQRYGPDAAVVHRAMEPPVPPAPGYDLRRDGLTVGLMGTVYSYTQLPVLAEAVILAAARLGVPGRLVVAGNIHLGEYLRDRFAGRLAVEALGHVPEDAGIGRMRGCLAVYLNYPFGWVYRELRETSFPTKLTSYVLAARPVLVHAPVGSTVDGLPTDRGYASFWRTMDPADGAALLVGLARTAADSFHPEAERVRQAHYDAATHRATMGRLLDALTTPA